MPKLRCLLSIIFCGLFSLQPTRFSSFLPNRVESCFKPPHHFSSLVYCSFCRMGEGKLGSSILAFCLGCKTSLASSVKWPVFWPRVQSRSCRCSFYRFLASSISSTLNPGFDARAKCQLAPATVVHFYGEKMSSGRAWRGTLKSSKHCIACTLFRKSWNILSTWLCSNHSIPQFLSIIFPEPQQKCLYRLSIVILQQQKQPSLESTSANRSA